MDIHYQSSPANTRRMPYLSLVADTFEEERILCGLLEVMDRGGTIVLDINERGEFPGHHLTCNFKGCSNANA